MTVKLSIFLCVLVGILAMEGRVVWKHRNRREIFTFCALFLLGSVYNLLQLLDIIIPSPILAAETVFKAMYLPLSDWAAGGLD